MVKGTHEGFWPHAEWLAEAEVKHCRSAMLAFVGTAVSLSGISFPAGQLGGFFYETSSWDQGLASSLSTNPFGKLFYQQISFIMCKF